MFYDPPSPKMNLFSGVYKATLYDAIHWVFRDCCDARESSEVGALKSDLIVGVETTIELSVCLHVCISVCPSACRHVCLFLSVCQHRERHALTAFCLFCIGITKDVRPL